MGRRASTAFMVTAILVGAFVMSAAAAVFGPGDLVVCGRGHILDRLAQVIMQPLGAGQVDGPSATYCTVPSTFAWLLAAGVLVLGLVFALLVSRRRRILAPGT